MNERLVIDLDRCDQCDGCDVDCAYFYRARPGEHGVHALRERATFQLVCRRCEEPSCVDACPFDALERQADGALKRHNLRCVSCKLCAQACPFGTIYFDMVPFYETPCDYCLGARDEAPPCVGSCRRGAITFEEVTGEEPRIHILDGHLAARSSKWVKQETSA